MSQSSPNSESRGPESCDPEAGAPDALRSPRRGGERRARRGRGVAGIVKALNFFDRHGNLIEPTAEHLFPNQDLAAKILAIEQYRPEISAETCVTQWQGEAMDMHLAVLNLVLKENSTRLSVD